MGRVYSTKILETQKLKHWYQIQIWTNTVKLLEIITPTNTIRLIILNQQMFCGIDNNPWVQLMTLFQEATAAMAKITIVIQMPQHCITHTTVRISFGSKIDCLSFVPGFS